MAQLTADDYKRAYEAYKNAGQINKAKEIGRQYQAFQQQQQQQQQDLADQPVDYDVTKSAENFPASLAAAGADFAHAVMNPIDTATALAGLARSGIANGGQFLQDILPESVVSNMNRLENTITGRDLPVENAKDYRLPRQEAGEAYVGMLDDRYGSMDKLKTTAMEDPAGVLLDLSSILTGGSSAVVKGGGKVGKIGAALDPITGVVKAPVAAVEAMTGQPISRQLYQSAMKPSTTIPKDKRVELLDQGLELGATPTIRSQNKIEAKKQSVYDEIEALENSVDASTTSSQGRLFEHVGEVKRDYNPPILNSAEALATIDKVVDAQLEALYLNGGQRLTVKDLSRIKRHIYSNVSYDKKLANRNIDKPSEETMKAIARSAKEQIEEIIPEIKVLNAEYGKIANVQNKIQNPAAARIGNRDLIGIGAPIKVAAGGAVDGGVGTFLGGALGMLDAPVTKSNLAIATNRAGKVIRSPNNPFKTAALSGRYEQAAAEDEEERKRERQIKEIRRDDR
jgi:hypothetical protein